MDRYDVAFVIAGTLGGNLWATRGRHPGWVVYGVAALLIIYGLGWAGR